MNTNKYIRKIHLKFLNCQETITGILYSLQMIFIIVAISRAIYVWQYCRYFLSMSYYLFYSEAILLRRKFDFKLMTLFLKKQRKILSYLRGFRFSRFHEAEWPKIRNKLLNTNKFKFIYYSFIVLLLLMYLYCERERERER